MVVSVDPVSGKTAAFSIPRDLLNFPLPNGKVYAAKVNALYQHLLSTTKNGNAAMKRAVAEAFDIEVDGLVLIGFDGVRRMVNAVGGVTVTLKESYYDSHYWVNGHTQGWGLSAGTHKLNAENALIFARSRKGDSDYGRATRQQQLVMAALEKVRDKGPELLPKLLGIAAKTVRTDLPSDRAAEIFDIVSRANLGKAKRAVFGPRAYGVILGPSRYELDLKKTGKWIDEELPADHHGRDLAAVGDRSAVAGVRGPVAPARGRSRPGLRRAGGAHHRQRRTSRHPVSANRCHRRPRRASRRPAPGARAPRSGRGRASLPARPRAPQRQRDRPSRVAVVPRGPRAAPGGCRGRRRAQAPRDRSSPRLHR